MKCAKAFVATLLATSVLAGHHTTVEETMESVHSVGLKQMVGEGKMTHLANRSLNKRSSDPKPSMWSSLTDTMFGAADTRTEFDRNVDAYVKLQ